MIAAPSKSIERQSKPCRGPVRLVHLVHNLNVGGLETLLIQMLSLTDRELVAPAVVCIGEPGDLADEVHALDIPLHSLRQPPGRNFRLPWLLARQFRSLDTDVVHTHGPYAHLYGAVAARLAGCPIVHTKHGYLWPWTRQRHLQNRIAATFSSRVVAVSKNLAEYLRDFEGISGGKLQHIYNGIDVSRFEVPRVTVSNGPPTAIMVSRLSTEKDFPTLLRAVPLIAKKIPGFQLVIIGDGPARGDIESLVRELHIEQYVQLLGTRSDVPAQLARAQLFVLCTNTEGLSIAILEAMASQLPVVATAVGGNPELVVDGQTGFLISPRSPEQLAEKICWLVEHPREAEVMGACGRDRVEKHFDVRQTVKAYEDLYLSLADRAHFRQPLVAARA